LEYSKQANRIHGLVGSSLAVVVTTLIIVVLVEDCLTVGAIFCA